jgi:CheY-like chemotaxis protein
MSAKPKILWIDDNKRQINAAKNLASELGLGFIFRDLKGQKFLGNVKQFLSDAQGCSLIVLDHRLDNIADKKLISGPSVAEIIRQKVKGIPIISVTAIDLNDVDERTKTVYDQIVEANRIGDHYQRIKSLIKGYQKLKSRVPRNAQQLLKYLKAPELDTERLIAVIPEEIKMGKMSTESIKKISDWVRGVLIVKPGFLINSLWAATFCGVRFESFRKIESNFKNSLYKGVFSNDTDTRWWKSLLISRIFSLNKKTQSIYPWEVGRSLRGINKRDFSVCAVCGEEYPEVVGYTDEKAETPIQLHLRCSVSHPQFEKSLFFEEIRIVKE